VPGVGGHGARGRGGVGPMQGAPRRCGRDSMCRRRLGPPARAADSLAVGGSGARQPARDGSGAASEPPEGGGRRGSLLGEARRPVGGRVGLGDAGAGADGSEGGGERNGHGRGPGDLGRPHRRPAAGPRASTGASEP
jgi:hypothetical protein